MTARRCQWHENWLASHGEGQVADLTALACPQLQPAIARIDAMD
jgi:hypothetical protein